MNSESSIPVRLNRDSVHPGDDLISHSTRIDIVSSATLRELIAKVRKVYLPGIAGGEATWVIDSSGLPGGSIGVLAQQWPEPKLSIALETPVTQLVSDGVASLYFRYLCQVDPELICSYVLAGKDIPDRYYR